METIYIVSYDSYEDHDYYAFRRSDSKPSITMKYIGVGSEIRRRMVANYDCGVNLDDYGGDINE